MADDHARLEGTTWYHHTIWLASYWKIRSDGIIRRIHLQDLRHVKRLAEADGVTDSAGAYTF